MMLANYIGAIALIVIGFYAMITKRDRWEGGKK